MPYALVCEPICMPFYTSHKITKILCVSAPVSVLLSTCVPLLVLLLKSDCDITFTSKINLVLFVTSIILM